MDFEDKNYGIWLMVKPTVGLPIFFIAIMITSFVVHYAILSHTTWFSAYWQGHSRSGAASLVVPAPAGTPARIALDSSSPTIVKEPGSQDLGSLRVAIRTQFRAKTPDAMT